jgi:glycosyltransferase involved in cell wall biosynthesis
MPRVRAAAGPNVQVLGHQPFEVLKQHMQNAKAFVFAAEEDFGITPVEAQACGTPVIAFGRGGTLETVVEAGPGAPPTGQFFSEQTVPSIIAAVRDFELRHQDFSPQACRANAEKFSVETFATRLTQTANEAVRTFCY